MPSTPPLSYPSRAMNREDFLLYLVALALPVGLLAYGLWEVYLGYVQFGPAAMVAWGQPWFIASAIFALPLFLLTVRAVILARREVLVAEQGLILHGVAKKPLAWKNLHGIAVEDVRYHLFTLPLRTRRRLYLYPTAGRPLTLDDRFRDLPGLAETIKTRLYPLLLPDLRKQLQTDQWVYFGPIRFTRKEFDTGTQTLPWDQINSLRAHAGFLLVERTDRAPLRLPTAKIPNVELLLQLVEELYTGL
ncbi:MAG TPA: hypothetical protein PK530_13525 [Anaerolineales bacterium]|nr:hypothetical protein [Anaerolineales bacterium]